MAYGRYVCVSEDMVTLQPITEGLTMISIAAAVDVERI